MREMERLGLHMAIERLPERARHVLIRRYGLEDRRKAALAELSRELGSPGNESGRCRRRP
jgi:RNA polymerase primary sigma factor